MRKTIALSGAAQDAYFRRLLKAHPGLAAEARELVLARLRREIAQLHLRPAPPGREGGVGSTPPVPPQALRRNGAGQSVRQSSDLRSSSAPVRPATTAPFDPFLPNIVVVVRTSGRAAALAALDAIQNEAHLRLLAHEQRLSVKEGLSSLAELRAAIVAAAERRIANRVAAAR